MLLCITQSMPGRPCMIRGHHLSACSSDDCRGCLPRPAETGILCRSCWERFEAALGKAVDLVTHLRSIERGPVSADGVRTSTVITPTFPPSWQAADRLWVALARVAIAHAKDTRSEEPEWSQLTSIWAGFSYAATIDDVARTTRELVSWVDAGPQSVVSRTEGAMAAVDFFREVQRSLAMFPMDEKSARIRYLRCRFCLNFAVVDRPPLHYLEPRVDVCESCGELSDPQMREWDLKLYRLEVEDQMQSAVVLAGRKEGTA